jgi:hypothetical protein
MIILAAVACAACGSSGAAPTPAPTHPPRTSAPASSGDAGGASAPARVASPQPEPTQVSFTAAYADPCLLITLQEAQAILNSSAVPPPEPQGKLCFINLSATTSVSFALIAASYSPAGVVKNIPHPAPVPGLGSGHPALCGTSTPSPGNSDIQLEAAASPDYTLAVIGTTPCTTDAQFAKTLLGNLVGG